MASTVITVTGMTCSHCVAAVQSEIGKLPGVAGVDVDLDTGSVTVTAEPLPEADALRAAVAEAGYELAG
ncbi:MAG TPA: heavy metal-associated domain-containing protein [Streptosporangiaceae bacterium]|nr:heavy metal-associated domain-containing protein [Streptosporangiaceae bacterium]